MTPTERTKRSDALYYETVSVNRRVLCDMVANREADLEDAKAENAKLREWCSDFWKWADPPFALKSGTFDEYMALVERAVELGVIK